MSSQRYSAEFKDEAVHQLWDHPKMGRDGRLRGTHELVIHGIPYIVPYRIKRKEIQILSVYHTSRKSPESFESRTKSIDIIGIPHQSMDKGPGIF